MINESDHMKYYSFRVGFWSPIGFVFSSRCRHVRSPSCRDATLCQQAWRARSGCTNCWTACLLLACMLCVRIGEEKRWATVATIIVCLVPRGLFERLGASSQLGQFAKVVSFVKFVNFVNVVCLSFVLYIYIY